MLNPPRRVILVVSLLSLLVVCLSSSVVSSSSYPRTLRDSTGREVTLTKQPERIFSGGLNVDSTLLRLLPPERVVAVTRYSGRPDYSFVADSASLRPSYRQVRAETVLKHDPDLVILTVYTRADIRRKIRELDVPVIVTGTVNSRDDIKENTMLIARAVGKKQAARRWLKRMDRELSNIARDTSGPRVLYYTYSGSVPGRGTLPNLIMSVAGIRNVAADVGIEGWKVLSPEKILQTEPDWLVFEQQNRSQLIKKLRNDPALKTLEAVKQNRFRGIKPKYLTVASPHIHRAARYWANLFDRVSDEKQ